jgi:hypothetical protein
VWLRSGDKRVSSWSIKTGASDASVAVVGGTLVFVCGYDKYGWQTVGFDPADGSLKWVLTDTGGGGSSHAWPSNGLPGIYRERDREYLVLGRSMPPDKVKGGGKPDVPENFLLVGPADGAILWESEALGYNGGHIAVSGDIAAGNVRRGMRDLPDKKENRSDPGSRVGTVRLSLEGAKLLWASDSVNYVTRRSMSVLHDGMLYLDTRRIGFRALALETGEGLGQHPGIYSMSHSSHNWAWHVATNDRVLTDGVLMFSTGGKGFRQLPGRLGVEVSGGYLSPTKPAVADGRIVMRLSDKLVCYDLRQTREAAATEVINLTAQNATVSGPISADVQIRIRKRGGRLISIAGKAPRTATDDVKRSTSWGPVDWSSATPWRSTIPYDLALSGDRLAGPAIVRLGYQYEPWQLDLAREGDRFAGTYTRRVPALREPLAVRGEVVGPIVENGDGTRYFNCYLVSGAASVRDLREGRARAGFSIIVSCRGDEVTGAASVAGRMNQASHEVQIDEITVRGNSLKGRFTVIVHDDFWGDMHIESARSECRTVGRGPALAMRYTVETTGQRVRNKDGEWKTEHKGTYSGTIGVEWRRSDALSGTLTPEAAD